MGRVHIKQTDPEREARAMREHQSRVERKSQFIQEDLQKREQLYELWEAAGFKFVPKRTYQPDALWEANGVPAGLSLLRMYKPSSFRYGSETYHRLIMAQGSVALHYIKEAPNSCRPQLDLTPDEVYKVVQELGEVEHYFKNRDELIEILASFVQPTVELTDEQDL